MKRRKITRLRKMSANDRLLLLEACATLFLAKLLVIVCSFNVVAKLLGKVNQVSGFKPSAEQMLMVAHVQRVLSIVSSNVPWSSVCLDKALAAMIMLNRRRIPNTLYLGVKLNKDKQKLDAHAWVECNDSIFVGGAHSKNYRTVAFFSKY